MDLPRIRSYITALQHRNHTVVTEVDDTIAGMLGDIPVIVCCTVLVSLYDIQDPRTTNSKYRTIIRRCYPGVVYNVFYGDVLCYDTTPRDLCFTLPGGERQTMSTAIGALASSCENNT